MTHKTEIIEHRLQGDGAIVLRARCCGDPSTDSQHTSHDLDNIEKEAEELCARVAALHEKRCAAEEKVKALTAASED